MAIVARLHACREQHRSVAGQGGALRQGRETKNESEAYEGRHERACAKQRRKEAKVKKKIRRRQGESHWHDKSAEQEQVAQLAG